MLSALGLDVEISRSARAPFDLLVEGEPVEVKAAIKTSYPGSKGGNVTAWVFSNFHGADQARYYLLLCMDPKRRRVLTWYMIPSKEAPQRTLSITEGESAKYSAYKESLPSKWQAAVEKQASAYANIPNRPYPPMASGSGRSFVNVKNHAPPGPRVFLSDPSSLPKRVQVARAVAQSMAGKSWARRQVYGDSFDVIYSKGARP